MGNQITCKLGLSSCSDKKKPSDIDEVQLQENTNKVVSELRNKINMLPVQNENELENEFEDEFEDEAENELGDELEDELVNELENDLENDFENKLKNELEDEISTVLENDNSNMNNETTNMAVKDYVGNDFRNSEYPKTKNPHMSTLPRSKKLNKSLPNQHSINHEYIPNNENKEHNTLNGTLNFEKSELQANIHKSAFQNIVTGLPKKQAKSRSCPLHITIRDINISYNIFSHSKQTPKNPKNEISNLMCDLICDDDDPECFCRI